MKVETHMTYIALDIDGTLFDSTHIVAISFREGIQNWCAANLDHDVAVPEGEVIMRLVGMPAGYIFSTLFPDATIEQQYQLLDYCTAALCDAIREGKGHVFNGAVSTLRKLHGDGYGLLAASNGQRDYIEAILETHDIADLFSPWTTLEEIKVESKVELVSHYIATYGEENTFIMVGDRSSDLEAARANNIPFIGCAFGHASDEIAGYGHTVHHFPDIPLAIREIEKGNPE